MADSDNGHSVNSLPKERQVDLWKAEWQSISAIAAKLQTERDALLLQREEFVTSLRAVLQIANGELALTDVPPQLWANITRLVGDSA